jgi:drug/metabolite transporter superfamily protein YnfA
MSLATSLVILLMAAVLEAGGDALLRLGIHAGPGRKPIFFVAGALILFAYGYTVNAPQWDFGRLLGIYVVFFFVVAQVLSWLVFQQRPTAPVLLGGGFIIVGGAIMAAGSRLPL